MLPSIDLEGRLTSRLAFVYAGALLPITAALSAAGITGGVFLAASQVVGIAFLALGWVFLRQRSLKAARRLFLASILYLPVVLGLGVADMTVRGASAQPAAAEIAASSATLTADAHGL
jgi:protoheme IX farnesyltransferase